MKLLVLILISLCTASNGNVPEMFQFSADDARVRRGAVSYRTNVVHQNPNHPDQHAESSITVDFHTNKQALETSRKRPKIISDHSLSQQTVTQNRPDHSQVFGPPQSQAFNVGYSVRFRGTSQEPQPISDHSRPSDDIITGSLKELVQKPTSSFNAQDFVNNALIGIKKQKNSGIKPKYNKHNNKDNDGKSFITHVVPKTQGYLSYLGNPNPIASSNTGPRPHIQETTESLTSPWTSLSPTVEIYQSKELLPSFHTEKVKHFDHKGALGKSQDFGYTDVLDGFDQYENFQSKENRVVPVIETADVAPPYKAVQILPITSLQVADKTASIENIKKPKLPIDVSLLRNPVLTSSGKNTPSDPNILPIPFDISFLQAMQQNLASSLVNDENKNIIQKQRQLLHGHSIQPVQEHMGINQQQAAFLRQGPFDQYFNRYLDSIQPQESLIDTVTIPIHAPNYNSRLNAAKDIEMDLRPPPIPIHRRRRTFMY